MSSMRSASSSTRTSSPASFAYGWVKWSSRRPGVATMTSTPLRNACSCGPMPTPPNTDAAVTGVWTARSLSSSTIWAASSRVGVSTRARVVPRGLSIRRWRIGRTNAAVFPLPVMAAARTSRPASAGGMASTWIGVGRAKPSSFTPLSRLGWSLSDVNGTRTPGWTDSGKGGARMASRKGAKDRAPGSITQGSAPLPGVCGAAERFDVRGGTTSEDGPNTL